MISRITAGVWHVTKWQLQLQNDGCKLCSMFDKYSFKQILICVVSMTCTKLQEV